MSYIPTVLHTIPGPLYFNNDLKCKRSLKSRKDHTELSQPPQPSYQFLGPKADENPLGILTVMPALHQGQQKLGGIVLITNKKKILQ